MFASCIKKQNDLKLLFHGLSTQEEKYEKIIELGRAAPSLSDADKIEENLVDGCQSIMYLKTTFNGERVTFQTESEALISSGLGVLLTCVYSGETPETILKCPPTYLDEIGISSAISPNRASGLYSLHLKMKQEAIKCLVG